MTTSPATCPHCAHPLDPGSVHGHAHPGPNPDAPVDPAVEALVHEVIGQVADKWTLLILEELEASGTLRFTEVGRRVPGISQKMLTQTLRQMECKGLVTRTVHPVVPPRVEYTLTPLGHSLSEAFCGVWTWAETHYAAVQASRQAFAARQGQSQGLGFAAASDSGFASGSA